MAACLIPQDVPGTIEVFMNREGSGDEDSVCDDSGDKPLAAKRSRQDPFIPKPNPNWRKCIPSSQKILRILPKSVMRKNCDELKVLNPVQI
ncbi:unnamed protein product [Arctia plantaginis]|uniref:Uncharacterized protein n=1 Tax=Arctia plantaginis TaxID=874455 RepID=A0A8S0ZYM0_ARCPL|nr:unnamed protein product [Arctia plantaginis]CAB3255963.1 unnamed protein product [Arctia plantaginis]